MEQAIRIIPLEGNRQMLDGGAMFGNAPKALWSRWHNADELGRIELACHSAYMELDGKKVLLETGIGAFFPPDLAQRYGISDAGEHKLLDNLKSHHINPKEIDYVILSHLHFDHAGGLLPAYDSQRGSSPVELIFPNAKIIVGRIAYERAKHPHLRDRASFIPELMQNLAQNPHLLVVDEMPPPELKPYLSFRLSHGHTPGQLHTVVQGPKQRLIFAGDLIPGMSWVHLPMTMGYDRYAEKVIDEKTELYEWLKPGDILFFTHDARFCAAEIERDAKGKYQGINPREQGAAFLLS